MKKLVGHLWGTYLKPFLEAAKARTAEPAKARNADAAKSESATPNAEPPKAEPAKPLPTLHPQRQIRTLTFLVETGRDTQPDQYRFKVDLANDGIWIRNANEGMLAGRMRARIVATSSDVPCHVTIVGDETGKFTVPTRPKK